MHFKSVVAAFFALTLSGVAHAEEDRPGAVNPEYSLPISYGKCYHLVNPSLEYIGHDWTSYGYLKFGRRANAAILKVCANMQICTSNKPSEVVQASEEWYLYDTQGSTFSCGGAFITGWRPGYMFPAALGGQKFMVFRGMNEQASYSDSAIRLFAHDSFYPFTTGLHMGFVDSEYIYTQFGSQEGILIDFEEVNCAPSF